MNNPSNDTGKPDISVDKTIDNLCSGLKPCKPCSPLWRSLLWMILAVSYVLAVALMVGIDERTMERLTHHHFIYEIVLSFATGITASIATFFLTVPDVRNKEWFLSIPATLFGVHLLWMFVRWMMEGVGLLPANWFGHCWMDCIMMAGVPAAAVLILIRKGATVRPRFLAFNAVLAIASFSWVGIRLICPFETVGKAYFVNFLPFLVAGIVFGLIARKLFKW